jgi:hypothetical protein
MLQLEIQDLTIALLTEVQQEIIRKLIIIKELEKALIIQEQETIR